jgi:hypothetical protein
MRRNSMDVISQYILSLVPSCTAIIGMIVFIGVGIGKIRRANESTKSEIKKIQKKHEEELEKVHSDLIDLDLKLKRITSKFDKVHFVEKDKKGE